MECDSDSIDKESICIIASSSCGHTGTGSTLSLQSGSCFMQPFDEQIDPPEEEHVNPAVERQAMKSIERKVFLARILVVVVLLLALAMITGSLHMVILNREKEKFENQFLSYASEIRNVVQDKAKSAVDAAETFSTSATSWASASNSVWPFVTLPNFTSQARRLAKATGAYFVGFAPILDPEDVPTWLNYHTSTINHDVDSYYKEAIAVSGYNDTTSQDLISQTIPFPWTIDPNSGDIVPTLDRQDSNSSELRGPLDFQGLWLGSQFHPLLNDVGLPLTNIDLLASGFEDAFLTTNQFHMTSFDMHRKPIIDPETKQVTFVNSGETQMVQPVYETIDNGGSNRKELKLVAAVLLLFNWQAFFSNLLLQDRIHDVEIVLSSTCSAMAAPFTYRVTSDQVIEVGTGDLHDVRYNDMNHTYPLFVLDHLDKETRSDIEQAGMCFSEVFMHIYPTRELEKPFYTSAAMTTNASVVGIFIFISLVFFLYDGTVRRRQSKVMEQLHQQDKILLNTNKELLRQSKARTKAVEDLLLYREKVAREDEEKEKAAKLADSLLNHTLKNIMADGIASIELYEQESNSLHLQHAKHMMKQGMWWTRRRQSLIMVCQGNYQPQMKTFNLQGFVLECINGRAVSTQWDDCGPHLKVETDPMLLSLAMENGITNSIKHNPQGCDRPIIVTRVKAGAATRSSSKSFILEMIIQNKATPGAPFITEEIGNRLFQEGMHGKVTTANSDGIGLGHARMMAELLGGSCALKQEGDTIMYTLTVPIAAPVDEHWRQPIVANTTNAGSPLLPALVPWEGKAGQPERGMFIDDSLTARKYAAKVLMPRILGMREWLILGENQDQIDNSVLLASVMKPHIIIIDENLELLDAQANSGLDPKYHTGTQICKDLEKTQIGALLCIRSGNTAPDDVKKYLDAGAHCVICKSYDNKALAEPLLNGYKKLQEEQEAKSHGTFLPRETGFPILLLD